MKKAIVKNNIFLQKSYFLLTIEADFIAQKALPGQFIMLKAWPEADPLLARPFSIHDIEENQVSLLYQVKGRGTKLMSFLKKGDVLEVLGPLGKGFPLPHKRRIFLVAGGLGIAPFLFTAKSFLSQGYNLELFYGAREEQDLLRLESFTKLSLPLHISTEDGSQGYKGLVTDLLSQALSLDNKVIIFACGPWPMLKAVAKLAKKNKTQGFASLEARMACGLGLCLGCVVKAKERYIHVCKEGPVVNLENII